MSKLDRLLALVQAHLEPQEKVLAAVLGTYETKRLGVDSIKSGTLIATDRRVIFYSKRFIGFDLEHFPYSNISSFEMGSRLMGPFFKFFASGNEVHIKWISKGDAAQFAEIVRRRMKDGDLHSNRSESTKPSGIVDEIERLARLRESGILSQSEFQTMKDRLLEKR